MPEQETFTPRGAWAFALVFLVLLVTIWGAVYLLLLSKGPTV